MPEPKMLYIGAPNPEGWGPWVGVPEERQTVCAVEGCIVEGKPQRCFADGGNHHHGCVHYQRLPNTIAKRKASRWLAPNRMKDACGF